MDSLDPAKKAAKAKRIQEARQKYAKQQRGGAEARRKSPASGQPKPISPAKKSGVRSEAVAAPSPSKSASAANPTVVKPKLKTATDLPNGKRTTSPRRAGNTNASSQRLKPPAGPGRRPVAGKTRSARSTSSDGSSNGDSAHTSPKRSAVANRSRGRGRGRGGSARGRGRGKVAMNKARSLPRSITGDGKVVEDRSRSRSHPQPGPVAQPDYDNIEPNATPSPPPRHPHTDPMDKHPEPSPHPSDIPIVIQDTYETPIVQPSDDDSDADISDDKRGHTSSTAIDVEAGTLYAEIDPSDVQNPDQEVPMSPASPRRLPKLFRNPFKRHTSSERVASGSTPQTSPKSSRRGTAEIGLDVNEDTPVVALPTYEVIDDDKADKNGNRTSPLGAQPPITPARTHPGNADNAEANADNSSSSAALRPRAATEPKQPSDAVSAPYLAAGQRISMPPHASTGSDQGDFPSGGPVAPPRPACTFPGAEAERYRSDIVLYLEQLGKWVKPYEQVEVSDVKLGDGQFGLVKEAYLKDTEYNQLVAVKMPAAIRGDNLQSRAELLREATMMATLSEEAHINVLSLLGVVSDDRLEGGLCIVMDHCGRGDLRQLLLEYAPRSKHPYTFTPGELISFGAQIAAGMAYLAEKHLVHRDLAARNILVDNQYVAKIADYGLAREENYEAENTRALPFRWMSPEALSTHVYTTASDVWSYGITLYEIFTFGSRPYPQFQHHQEVVEYLSRHEPPVAQDAPDAVKSIMRSCWRSVHDRPSFDELYRSMIEAQASERHSKRRPGIMRFLKRKGRRAMPKLDVMTDAALLDMCKEGVASADDVLELQRRYGEGNLRLKDDEMKLSATDRAYALLQRFQVLVAEESSSV
eukprot:TRINITY_DN10475_c0_g1_i1.p1 TRINITY_DN10475_c0_g1~~TRINITY_DN10475_c0_g1_i1.p1  ORF type:complete len:867 (+),score=170.31 TRINITY_DN10475_c0_g1_i1:78-2678(+)